MSILYCRRMKNKYSDWAVFRHVPELRTYVLLMWGAKLLGWSTLVIMSPLFLVGMLAIGIVMVMDYVGRMALWAPHKVTAWLYKFQQDQIRNAHDEVSIDEIHERIGTDDK